MKSRKRVSTTQRDLEGFLYEIDAETNFAYRVTSCCHACATIDQDSGGTMCKSCYNFVDPRIGGTPVLIKQKFGRG